MFDSRTDAPHKGVHHGRYNYKREALFVGYDVLGGVTYRQAHQEPAPEVDGVEPFTLTAAYLAKVVDGPTPEVYTSETPAAKAARMVIEHFAPTVQPLRVAGTINATKRSRVSVMPKDENAMRVHELAKVCGVSTDGVLMVLKAMREYAKDGRSVVSGVVATQVVEAYGL